MVECILLKKQDDCCNSRPTSVYQHVNNTDHMRFNILMTVTTTSSGFWVVTPCSLAVLYKCFGVMYCLRVWGQE